MRKQPENFVAAGFEQNKKYQNVGWSMLFLGNFVCFVVIAVSIIYKTIGFDVFRGLNIAKNELSHIQHPDLPDNEIFRIITFVTSLCIGTSLLINVLHIIFAVVYPKLYYRSSIYFTLVLGILSNSFFLYSSIVTRSYFLVLLSVFGYVGVYFLYRRMNLYFKSASVLICNTAQIIARHPTLVLLEVGQTILLSGIQLLFVPLILLIEHFKYSRLLYFYFAFTYYWVWQTAYYVIYMTGAGVVGNDLYFKGTPNESKFPVLSSFKRAITQCFGCAAFAGIILAIIRVLQLLVDHLDPRNQRSKTREASDDDEKHKTKKDNSALFYLLQLLLYYVLSFVLSLFQSAADHLSRHALIYCAIYGMPFKDACVRWTNKGLYKIINKINNKIMIEKAFHSVHFVLTLVAVVIIGLVTYLRTQFLPTITYLISGTAAFFGLILMISFSNLLFNAFSTTADTIFVAYMESPLLMKQHFSEIYGNLEQNSPRFF